MINKDDCSDAIKIRAREFESCMLAISSIKDDFNRELFSDDDIEDLAGKSSSYTKLRAALIFASQTVEDLISNSLVSTRKKAKRIALHTANEYLENAYKMESPRFVINPKKDAEHKGKSSGAWANDSNSLKAPIVKGDIPSLPYTNDFVNRSNEDYWCWEFIGCLRSKDKRAPIRFLERIQVYGDKDVLQPFIEEVKDFVSRCFDGVYIKVDSSKFSDEYRSNRDESFQHSMDVYLSCKRDDLEGKLMRFNYKALNFCYRLFKRGR